MCCQKLLYLFLLSHWGLRSSNQKWIFIALILFCLAGSNLKSVLPCSLISAAFWILLFLLRLWAKQLNVLFWLNANNNSTICYSTVQINEYQSRQLQLHISIYTVFFNITLPKSTHNPVDTGRKLNVHKTFRKRPRRLLNVLCTFNLRPVSAGITTK